MIAIRSRRDSQNWGSIATGIVTLASAIAAATSAGFFAVAPELFDPEQTTFPALLRAVVMLLTMTSLSVYLIVVVSGLAVFFCTNQADRIARIRQAAIFVWLQVYTAIISILIIIFYQILRELSRLV